MKINVFLCIPGKEFVVYEINKHVLPTLPSPTTITFLFECSLLKREFNTLRTYRDPFQKNITTILNLWYNLERKQI